ncbi:DNA-processing protein DprA [Clostridium sp. AWRP]|uniref:DNA-processing protein DprA n=1 Tax=Clostridium sp. AWRP TaxID=2212991 RepID=UPI000FD8DDDB|nr:DNA-processing protein DprA [Clostridium sp. AWRP]AZV56295.1 DNA-protecting protein DprA [Clostridium sp. AWRP]
MNIYDLWFACVKISNKLKISILKKFKSTREVYIHSIYNDGFTFLRKSYPKIYDEFKKAWNGYELQNMLQYCSMNGINAVNFCDKEYPARLKNYEDSPAVLFYKGNIKKLNDNFSVSIVGARDCSLYGKNLATLISREVTVNNISIISGMARGVDSYAQSAAVEKNGYTCAVLGSGVDVIYPRQNRKLYESILKGGCVLSEFVPKTKPYPYNFPLRNRIISGLSDVVIVIEAGDKSGSLITASCALEQGKDVMAVPGSIFSPKSRGTNKLIKDGAYVFTCLEDLFDILPVEYINKTCEKKNKLSCKEEKICNVIGHIPMHIDEISRTTNVDIKRLYELLFELQLKGEIMCLAGNYYVKVEGSESITT